MGVVMLHAGERMLVAALPESFESLADQLGCFSANVAPSAVSAIFVSNAMRAATTANASSVASVST